MTPVLSEGGGGGGEPHNYCMPPPLPPHLLEVKALEKQTQRPGGGEEGRAERPRVEMGAGGGGRFGPGAVGGGGGLALRWGGQGGFTKRRCW